MSYLYETHFHTSEVSPCGNVTAADGVRLYRNAGYDGILVTDHFSTDYLKKDYKGESWQEKIDYYLNGYRTAKQYESADFTVMLGIELRLPENANDYVILGVDEDLLYENEWFTELSLKQFRKFALEHELTIIQAHPFRKNMTVCQPNLLDGMEVFNGNRRHDSSNEIALAWAKRFGLLPSSGSDFHETEDLARGGIYLEERVSTSKELRKAFLSGRYTLKNSV